MIEDTENTVIVDGFEDYSPVERRVRTQIF